MSVSPSTPLHAQATSDPPAGSGALVHRRFLSLRFPGHWLHYVQAGEPGRPVVLLVHGGSGNWSNYRAQITDLAKDYQVFAPDLRGHGASPWPGKSTIDDFYSDLEELAGQLPGPFFLVGHSFGGYMVMRLAATHPDWVRNLTLINTANHVPRGVVFRFLQLLCPLADYLARPEGKIATGRVVTEQLTYHVVKDWDCLPYYRKIEVPTLVIMGVFDPLIPFPLAWRSAKRLRQSRIKILPLGFHVAMWDRPHLVSRWLREHFQAQV